MAPNPNAWWSSDFGKEATKALLEPFQRLTPRKRVQLLLIVAAIFAVEISVLLLVLHILRRMPQ
jgi:hypothetical protein